MPIPLDTFRQLLCQLGAEIRDTLRRQQSQGAAVLSAVASRTSADVIYQIDKISETLVLDWLARNWPPESTVQLIMEGIEDHENLVFPENADRSQTRFKLIIDPIDGTRGIMYDKRSAWALLGLAPQKGDTTTLEDIDVAVMTELPTSKQYLAEELSATRRADGSTTFHRVSKNLISGEQTQLAASPSRATDLRHGFASVAKFFPQAKTALAAFEEELFTELTPESERQETLVFDDQYISTGGQLYEIIAGHDRAVFDIRPLAFRKHGLGDSLTCHPYDLCAALVARAAGAVVETPEGAELNYPLNTTTSVSWIAYANETLASQMRPVVERLLQKHFG